ncbi:MAG: toll/interleukin-1 receptor domain-containing protein, partial [Thauera sp.]|nr:toll/interleukin-1 receptor domain-containing protein [Thauera sp.]
MIFRVMGITTRLVRTDAQQHNKSFRSRCSRAPIELRMRRIRDLSGTSGGATYIEKASITLPDRGQPTPAGDGTSRESVMSIARGFAHDLFISYAHADDRPSSGRTTGFVSQFVRDLMTEVARKLGGELDVWWDRQDLAGNMPVSPEIVQAASQAAGIVVLVSPAYLRSEWCRRERSTFLQALRARTGSGAVFIVSIENLAREKLPEELQDLDGYHFWKELEDDRTTRPLQVDFDGERQTYYDRLCKLVQNVADHLDSLADRSTTTAATKGVASADAPRVVLAEVTDDLVHQREDVRSYLEQLGFVVLPKRRYSRDDLALHRTQLREDLEQARLFVQLLGPLAGDRTDEPRGMAWLRWSVANAVLNDESIIQWRDPQLVLDSVGDADAQALLRLPTVRSCGLAELKRAIAETLQRPKRTVASPVPKCVFVNAEGSDRGFADQISAWLAGHGYIVLDPPITSDPAEWREAWESNLAHCQSLMLIYGQTKPAWITQQVLQSMKVNARRSEPIELWSVCVGPPPAEPDKLSRLGLRFEAL